MSKNKEIRLSDYVLPAFLIDNVDLDIDIREDHARVTSHLKLRRNPQHKNKKAALFLNGENQRLLGVVLNGRVLSTQDYQLTPEGLTIPHVPHEAILEIGSTHNPYGNTALSGLYASGNMLCTQCEAEGFRRITYYPDRPDVMAKFRVTIHADRKKFPTLLSNGNLISLSKESKDRHKAIWEDPYPKPCYLFAMVAGKLEKVADRFHTKSGRNVLIEIYVEPGKKKETGFARAAIKKAMKWDEDIFGLEYDLDRFMIVTTPFFNMGAMENKGLNIFNDSCALGSSETTTDSTISFIERVVGHEYFHNWTGDRITCRDWFQLSLKEGLTVFREQEFMGDMHSVAVERLESVRDLRRVQFAEDAGTMAHPVRPDRYEAIDNFYTATVYDKGSEVVRMIQTLVGYKGFQKGMNLYVKRHDGQAVTCDDFVRAMADANKIDLKQFMLWYSQAGTPVLKVSSSYNEKAKELKLKIRQSTAPTPGQKIKKPLHIPFAVGMLNHRGKDLIGTRILSLKKPLETFTFKNIPEKPVLSLLRNFSAPVRLEYKISDHELMFLLAHDHDPFNRWESSVKLLTKYLLDLTHKKSVPEKKLQLLTTALGNVLRDPKIDATFKAMTLTLPSENELGLTLVAQGQKIDTDALYQARKKLVLYVAQALHEDFFEIFSRLSTLNPKASDGISMGKRSLKNLCLSYLAISEDPKILRKVYEQVVQSRNMTDRISALSILSDTSSSLRLKALTKFERDWKNVPTVMDKWLMVQASAKKKNVLKDVQRLMKHSAFSLKNPNRISALLGVFAGNNVGFHAKDGTGYRFMADMILKIDPINPNSAARLAKSFTRWKDYEPHRQKLMLKELKRLAQNKGLSPNTAEIVSKSLT